MLALKISITLDGFVGGPNGELDWMWRHNDDASAAWVLDRISRADIHIMGSRSFADMSAWWPSSTEPFAKPMNEIPKAVFSRTGKWQTTTALQNAKQALGNLPRTTPAQKSWDEAEIMRGELAEDIAALKQRYGLVLAHGGARFAQALVAASLIDEYWLLVRPVALGQGLPLFSGLEKPLDLTVIDSCSFPSGNRAMILKPA